MINIYVGKHLDIGKPLPIFFYDLKPNVSRRWPFKVNLTVVFYTQGLAIQAFTFTLIELSLPEMAYPARRINRSTEYFSMILLPRFQGKGSNLEACYFMPNHSSF